VVASSNADVVRQPGSESAVVGDMPAEGVVTVAIRSLLAAHGVVPTECHHAPTPTSEDSARARGEPLAVGGKALVIKAGDRWVICVLSAARKLDTRALRSMLGVRQTRFATHDELWALTQLVPGSVPPFGKPIFDVPLWVDQSTLAQPRIAFNAGSLTHSMMLPIEAYRTVANPNIGQFSIDR
jgi:Ala-tRNA(Pro) deacylase